MPQDPEQNADSLEDEDLHRWISDQPKESSIYTKIAQKSLGIVGELLSTSSKELLRSAMEELKGYLDSLERLVLKLEAEKSSGFILKVLKIFGTWLSYAHTLLGIYENEVKNLRITLEKLKEEKLERKTGITSEKELEDYIINELGINVL